MALVFTVSSRWPPAAPIGLATNRHKSAADHQRHAQDDEQRRRMIPTTQSINAVKTIVCIDERTKLYRRRVAICEHDQDLREELRKPDAKQVDPRPCRDRMPLDRCDGDSHHGGQQEVVEQNSRHRLSRA